MDLCARHLLLNAPNDRRRQDNIADRAEPGNEDLFQSRIFYKSKTSPGFYPNFAVMIITDSHAHLYLDAFDDDRYDMVRNAIAHNVRYIFLPNIDRDSIQPMIDLARAFPENCFPMMGLHPTSVGKDYADQLETVKEWLKKEKFYAIGEMGIDLYWDKTFFPEQQEAFRIQSGLALEYDLPLVIHSRNSFDEIFSLLDEVYQPGLRGVFHCFTGNPEQAEHIINLGFLLGIGGVLTYKKSGLPEVLEKIPLENILLETDAPFLPPVPFRGKRNESAYTVEVAKKLAEVKGISLEAVAEITTRNAIKLFNINA
jgi:TatD DNase family protein